MKHETYNLLRRAQLGNVDRGALLDVRFKETDPYIQRQILLIANGLDSVYRWNPIPFQSEEFLNAPARVRLDQVVFTFLLRLAILTKQQLFYRVFRKPESFDALLAWENILKECIYCVVTLLYNAKWTSERMLKLNRLVLELLHSGNEKALRIFLQKDMEINLATGEELTEAELHFSALGELHIHDYGSSTWRLLHWMAEAIDLRKDDNSDVTTAKRLWRQMMLGPFYRILQCKICMNHLMAILVKLKDKLEDETTPYATLWFEIHNAVTANKNKTFQINDSYQLQELQYNVDSYSRDREFMHQALVNNPS